VPIAPSRWNESGFGKRQAFQGNLMVIDAEAIPVRVAVREQPAWQQMVRQEPDARHCVSRRERRHHLLSRQQAIRRSMEATIPTAIESL